MKIDRGMGVKMHFSELALSGMPYFSTKAVSLDFRFHQGRFT